MFNIGSNWVGIAIVVVLVGGAMLLQGEHEKGKKWARPAQYILGVAFVLFMLYLMINI